MHIMLEHFYPQLAVSCLNYKSQVILRKLERCFRLIVCLNQKDMMPAKGPIQFTHSIPLHHDIRSAISMTMVFANEKVRFAFRIGQVLAE